MKLVIRTITELGPRTTVQQGLSETEAHVLARAASRVDGCEARVLEDGERVSITALMARHRMKTGRNVMDLRQPDPSPAYTGALGRALEHLEARS